MTSMTLTSGAGACPHSFLRRYVWVAQVVLAIVFATAGVTKVVLPTGALAQEMPWAADVPAALVRAIGVAEIAGAIAVFAPAATGLAPVLTPVAASALAAVMGCATVFHLFRGEVDALPLTVGLGVLAAFVAWGRRRASSVRQRDGR